MGAIFTVPVAKAADIETLPGTKIALVPDVGTPLRELERAPEATLLVGSEREGLPQTIIEQADRTGRIPVKTNSLNAAMAATVALYELAHRMQTR
jgi:TrmH family RNA methyltransferase